eukprot:COSAG02_NODE_37968_length_435_cov_0.726190_1_plen_45_part_00
MGQAMAHVTRDRVPHLQGLWPGDPEVGKALGPGQIIGPKTHDHV